MDNLEDFEDETLWERITALEEIIPNPIKTTLPWLVSSLFSTTKATTWAIASTAAILILPISLEMERQEYQEQMKLRERNILMGPE